MFGILSRVLNGASGGWGGVVVLQQKQHDGCEIQLLEGEDTHTLLLVRAPLKCDSYNYTAKICKN